MIKEWIIGKKLTFAVRKSEGADRRYWFEDISGDVVIKSLSETELETAMLEGVKIALQARLRRLPDDTLEKIATRVESITGGKKGGRKTATIIEAFKPSSEEQTNEK